MQTLVEEGRVWFRGAIAEADLAALDTACALEGAAGRRLEWSEGIAGALAGATRLAQSLVPGARPVRLVVFDKTDEANWGLPWHQDRVVALRDRVEAPGFTNWTRKAGVWHAEPPLEIMERMIFARVHLDPADEGNGCLELAIGTHRAGRIAEGNVAATAESSEQESCAAGRGDVLFASALILHRSRPSRSAQKRRALRIDYSADDLPPPLQWSIPA
jgi:hypothetical protein